MLVVAFRLHEKPSLSLNQRRDPGQGSDTRHTNHMTRHWSSRTTTLSSFCTKGRSNQWNSTIFCTMHSLLHENKFPFHSLQHNLYENRSWLHNSQVNTRNQTPTKWNWTGFVQHSTPLKAIRPRLTGLRSFRSKKGSPHPRTVLATLFDFFTAEGRKLRR